MKKIGLSAAFLVLFATGSALAGTAFEGKTRTPAEPEEKNWVDDFSVESNYTFRSDFRDPRFGHGDSFDDDISYDHRFHITGNWYLRAGAEYERFDFGGTNNGLPNHLQALYGHLAYEYVVHDHAGAGIEV